MRDELDQLELDFDKFFKSEFSSDTINVYAKLMWRYHQMTPRGYELPDFVCDRRPENWSDEHVNMFFDEFDIDWNASWNKTLMSIPKDDDGVRVVDGSNQVAIVLHDDEPKPVTDNVADDEAVENEMCELLNGLSAKERLVLYRLLQTEPL
jgi:hypothetical protein